jgi:hypothetical protein
LDILLFPEFRYLQPLVVHFGQQATKPHLRGSCSTELA